MTLDFHPAVQRDFNEAINYYEERGGRHLADRFETEFRVCVEAIKAAPTSFAPHGTAAMFRRIRLASFPYVMLYRQLPDVLRVVLLKHERRHPLYGTGRR